MQHEVRARIVVRPPKNDILRDMLTGAIRLKCGEAGPDADAERVQAFLNLAMWVEKKGADAKFYIGVIAYLNPVHDIFAVDYTPPIIEKPGQP